MKVLDLGRFALRCSLAAAVVSGCASSTGIPGGAPLDMRVQKQSGLNYTVLYSFGGSPTDGVNPQARLTKLNGTLYGTTVAGGSGCYASGGCGTVFAIAKSGAESILHSFAGGEDGAWPYAGVTAVNGVLYGATSGGASSSGSVFSVTTSGSETVLHNFEGTPDGSDPQASLIAAGGALYGTTVFGGSQQNRGVIFQIAASGAETVLHSFIGSRPGHRDGKYPEASLLNVNGTLYGTTYEGGDFDKGSVFKVTSSGSESVLHSFKGWATDGSYPRAGLVYVNGMLYGTTSGGGIGRCNGCGNHEHYGTVFAITPSGKERLIYKFKGYPNDGAVPDAQLLYDNGTFYGTTESGGANCAISHGCGTIFSITTSGSERMLYSFLPSDGAAPVSGLIDISGTLYGTTPNGGTYDEGTVYSFQTSFTRKP